MAILEEHMVKGSRVRIHDDCLLPTEERCAQHQLVYDLCVQLLSSLPPEERAAYDAANT